MKKVSVVTGAVVMGLGSMATIILSGTIVHKAKKRNRVLEGQLQEAQVFNERIEASAKKMQEQNEILVEAILKSNMEGSN